MEINVPQAGPSIPSVTFTELNTGLDYTLLNSERIQQTDFDTGQPAVWSDGNPRMHTVNTGIVIKGNAKIGEKDEKGIKTYRDLEPGEVVRVFMKSKTEKAWWDACKGRVIRVGDTVTDIHNDVAPPKNPSHNPAKLHAISISDQVDPAVRAAAEVKAQELAAAQAPAVEVTPAPAPVAAYSGPSADEKPF